MNLFTELRRRNVFRVGIAYAVAAWVLLQVFDVVGEILELPAWGGKLILAMLVIGFFIAVIVAWAYELTPEGVKRESEVDRSQSVTTHTGRKLNALIIGLLVLAVAYLLFDKFWLQPRLDAVAATPAATEAASAAALPEATPPDARPSVAVLPFDNRSRLEDDAFFVEGIHDDLLTNLARIGDLKVISRTSVLRYAGTRQPIPEIAAELGVAAVMEGAVQRSGDMVRINVQLIDAATDEHLWAEIFDRELTADNLFAIQSEISQAIATALKATLSPDEQRRISNRPTENLAAYNAYLRGRQALERRTSESIAEAIGHFQRAVTEDPEFAPAWVGVAEAHHQSANYGTALFRDTRKRTVEAIDHALAIDPELGHAWAWKANTLAWEQRYEEAHEAYRKAVRLSPNDPSTLQIYANFLAYQKNEVDEALAVNARAIELDPYSTVLRMNRASVLDTGRRFAEAREAYLEVLRLDPDFARAHAELATVYSQEFAEYEPALYHARRAVELDPGNPSYLVVLHIFMLNLGEVSQAEDIRDRLEALGPEHYSAGTVDLSMQIARGDFAAAAETIQQEMPKFDTLGNGWLGYAGWIEGVRGNLARARELMLMAQPAALEPDKWDEWIPVSGWMACGLGWILQRTGDEDIGTRLIQRSLEWIETANAAGGDPHRTELDVCLAAAGQHELALLALEQRLEHGHYRTWWSDRLEPAYRELRDDPRFVAAWQRVEQDLERQREKLRAEGKL